MCGIVGIYQSKKVDAKVLDRMTDSLAHRGPDDRGIFVDNNVGLGHRRLAILDLTSAGHQPMASADGRYVISYNGEVYNFVSIKKILQKKGYRFKSTSDTEVVLAAYEEWGEKSLDKFNGMWAFIVYDCKEKKLFACRDRLGIKPLYYYFDKKTLILASEIKAILEYPGVKVKVDPAALNEYFTFQNIYSDHTLFSGIKLLPSASSLTFDGQALEIKTWWDVPLKKEKLSVNEWEKKLRSALLKSVERHLISDVEIGSYLSGGMDSATISTLAARSNANLKTFTGGFDISTATGIEATFDERQNAEEIARTCTSEHYEVVMHSTSMAKVFPKLIWHLEDLRVGMCYPNYLISGLVSKFVKVVLSGAAGDELFGGYPWRYQIVKKAKNLEEFDQIYYDHWSRLIKDKEKPEFFAPAFARKIDFNRPFQEYRQIMAKVDALNPIEKALYFEIKTFLHGLLLIEDKVSMAHSIEVRVPFTDLDVLNLACSIPQELKIQGETGKMILRRVMKKILPPTISEKKKQGFSPPQGSWYRDESLKYVKEILLNRKTLGRGFFQPAYIKKIINEHTSGQKNHRLLIWSLLSFEWWCRIFLDGEGKVFAHKGAK